MTPRRYLMVVVAVAAVLLLSPIIFDGASADITQNTGEKTATLSGDVVLTKDLKFSSGTAVTIENGTNIDAGGYDIIFGEECAIVVKGDMTLTCHGGSVKMGAKCVMMLCGLVFPALDTEVVYTFDGQIVVDDSPLSEDGSVMKLVPSGDDHCLHATLDGTVISAEDPEMHFIVNKDGAEVKIGFASLSSVMKEYSEEELIQTSTVTVIPRNPSFALGFIADLDGIRVKELDPKEIHSVTVHEGTGAVDKVDILGIGHTSFRQTNHDTVEVKTSAEQAILTRESDGKVDSVTEFDNIYLEFEVDEKAIMDDLMEMVKFHKIIGDENALKRLYLTADSETTTDSTGMVVSYCTDIVLNINGDGSAKYYMTLTFKQGDDKFSLSCDQAVIKTFGITSNIDIDLDMTIPKLVAEKRSPEGLLYKITSDDTRLQLTDFGLMALYDIYARNGKVTVQEVLDNSEKVYVASSKLDLDIDGDGDIEISFGGLEALICENSRGMNTLTVGMSTFDIQGPYKDGTGKIHLDNAQIYMESNGSVSEVIDAFTSGIHFTTDVHADIQINISGISVDYQERAIEMGLITAPRSQTSPASMLISLTLEHSMYSGTTTLDGDVSTIGYELTLERHEDFYKPRGSQDLVLHTYDLSGSFRAVYGDKVEFQVDIHTDLLLEVTHYDIEFQVDTKDSTISINHGLLDVEGYDSSQEGMLAVINDMSNHDFLVSARLAMVAKAIYIYKDSGTVLNNEFFDPDISVKQIALDLVRGDHRLISLDRFELSVLKTDDTLYERTIDHLDMYKDLSDKPVEPSFLEEYAKYLLAIFVIASGALVVVLLYFRFKRPELFRFNERN